MSFREVRQEIARGRENLGNAPADLVRERYGEVATAMQQAGDHVAMAMAILAMLKDTRLPELSTLGLQVETSVDAANGNFVEASRGSGRIEAALLLSAGDKLHAQASGMVQGCGIFKSLIDQAFDSIQLTDAHLNPAVKAALDTVGHGDDLMGGINTVAKYADDFEETL